MEHLLGDRPLDYLLINHMEPDHGASIEEILIRSLNRVPGATSASGSPSSGTYS